MPGSFPIFDAVAGLGLLVVLLRTIALERMVRGIGRFAKRIYGLLASGKRERAFALCDQYPTAVFPPVARRLLLLSERLGPTRPEDEVRQRLNEAFDVAFSAQERRQHGSRARDIAALGVLLGAVAYLNYSGLGGSAAFHAFCGVGAGLLAYGVFTRSRLLGATERQRDSLVQACVEASRRMSSASIELGRCPTCGAELRADSAAPSDDSELSSPTSAEGNI